MLVAAERYGYDTTNSAYHPGNFGVEGASDTSFVINGGEEGFHVGSVNAAAERFSDIAASDAVLAHEVKQLPNGKFTAFLSMDGMIILESTKEFDTEEATNNIGDEYWDKLTFEDLTPDWRDCRPALPARMSARGPKFALVNDGVLIFSTRKRVKMWYNNRAFMREGKNSTITLRKKEKQNELQIHLP